MSEAGQQHSGLGRDPNLVGLLSLQILLLAFFILLVSISSFDTHRVRSVLDSVQAAFSTAAISADAEDDVNRADAVVLAGIIDEIEGVLATMIELDRVERVGNGAVQFDLAADALFATGTARLAPGRAALLNRIVAAIDRRPAGYRYDIEALVGRAQAPGAESGATAAPSTLEIDRAGALARALQESGAIPSGIAGGLLPDAAGRLRLVIHLSEEPRPHDLFAGAAAEPAP